MLNLPKLVKFKLDKISAEIELASSNAITIRAVFEKLKTFTFILLFLQILPILRYDLGHFVSRTLYFL